MQGIWAVLEWKPEQVFALLGAPVSRLISDRTPSYIYIQKAQLFRQVHRPGHEPATMKNHTHLGLDIGGESQGMCLWILQSDTCTGVGEEVPKASGCKSENQEGGPLSIYQLGKIRTFKREAQKFNSKIQL